MQKSEFNHSAALCSPCQKKKKEKKIQQDSLLFCLGLVTHLAFLRASSELVWVWFGLF
jgi:hypothetical protein